MWRHVAGVECTKGHGIKDDGIKDDGIKDDGIKDDGIKDDGIKDDGSKDDGIKDDGNKDDGIKDDGIKGVMGGKKNGKTCSNGKRGVLLLHLVHLPPQQCVAFTSNRSFYILHTQPHQYTQCSC